MTRIPSMDADNRFRQHQRRGQLDKMIHAMALQQLIDEGLALVQEEPQHELRLGFRCRVFSAFNAVGGRECDRAKRVKLATLAVEKVLPLWELRLPKDRTPHEALNLARELLSERVSSTAANEHIGQWWTRCDDLLWKHEEQQSVIMVGYAAIQVVREALSDARFGCGCVNDESTDLDIGPYDHDSSFFAAAAYSGGAPWDNKSDANKRLEFWRWWLTSALADAMRLQ
jgi:hypothetical protein